MNSPFHFHLRIFWTNWKYSKERLQKTYSSLKHKHNTFSIRQKIVINLWLFYISKSLLTEVHSQQIKKDESKKKYSIVTNNQINWIKLKTKSIHTIKIDFHTTKPFHFLFNLETTGIGMSFWFFLSSSMMNEIVQCKKEDEEERTWKAYCSD